MLFLWHNDAHILFKILGLDIWAWGMQSPHRTGLLMGQQKIATIIQPLICQLIVVWIPLQDLKYPKKNTVLAQLQLWYFIFFTVLIKLLLSLQSVASCWTYPHYWPTQMRIGATPPFIKTQMAQMQQNYQQMADNSDFNPFE